MPSTSAVLTVCLRLTNSAAAWPAKLGKGRPTFLIQVLGPYVARIPMAAPVAVMIMVSINTFQWRSLKTLLINPKSSSLVMLARSRSSSPRMPRQGVLFGVVLRGLFFAHKVTRFFTVMVVEAAEVGQNQPKRLAPGMRRGGVLESNGGNQDFPSVIPVTPA